MRRPGSELLRALHPARLRARWQRRHLRLDPFELPLPVAAPGPRDFLMVGSPRTGTTLAAAALCQPPSVWTVVEPWNGLRLPPQDLFQHWRDRLATGVADGGTLDLDALRQGRVVRAPEGRTRLEIALDPDFVLGIKWPTFFQYLEVVPDARYVVCLRHPFEVLGSMARMKGSNLVRGQDYDLPFNRRMNRTLRAAASDPFLRRVAMFDHVHERLLPHLDRPNVCVVRYERWFTEPEAQLAELSDFLGVPTSACPVRVTSPVSGRESLDPAEQELVRTRSTTAARLGYSL